MIRWLIELKNKFLSGQSVDAQHSVTYFAHIPKTAGTSFITVLDRYFDQDSIYPHQLWRDVEEIPASDHYQLYRGHLGGGGLKLLTDQPIRYLTIVRDPVDLTVSTWRFVLREPNTAVHDLVKQREFTLDDFLQHSRTRQLVENRMVRNLSFDFKEDADAQEVFLSPTSLKAVQQHVSGQQASLNDEHRYQRARTFLQNCIWFGLQDQFDASLQLFSYVFQQPPIGATQKLNKRRSEQPLSDAQMTAIRKSNIWDQRFYQDAQSEFDKRYQAMLEVLQTLRTSDDQSVDDLLDIHYQKHGQHALQQAVDFDFGQAMSGTGWHRRELAQPENNYFRWSGPGKESFLDFWLQPDVYDLQLRIINALDSALLDDLIMTANGLSLEWHSHDRGVVRVIQAQIASEQLSSNGLLRLGFKVKRSVSHAEAFQSNDERQVSFALHWIKISPCQSQK
ncbi:hypothetical protein [Marinicella sp. W31]|uniref:hypothetical protein n=1 Tax=Marinicella sp. W31 TaxID=3023713 RepID=UPI003756A889